jgi:hypothetical protein
VGEVLCRRKDLAPWIGIALVVLTNIVAIAYLVGGIQTRQIEMERRIGEIEKSDREQSKWLERIAGIEASVNYIRDAVRERKEK